MKFYITGRSNNYPRVEAAFAAIKAAGHEADFEWTALPMVKPYEENQAKAAEYATQGIAAAALADVYIIFTHEDGNGVFSEFGAALGGRAVRGDAPRIFAIGEDKKSHAMFYYHPDIEWVRSVEEVLEKVGK